MQFFASKDLIIGNYLNVKGSTARFDEIFYINKDAALWLDKSHKTHLHLSDINL